jgi:hypothetical protein
MRRASMMDNTSKAFPMQGMDVWECHEKAL